ncbi:hypothetical protein HanRHA438_Chr17g0811471 [Helianthus annuus]|uniref:Uncharacterized protein n=1 Tax=Helianthus annuus TaxID=4232 RepID=A0A9K3GTN1_HELAN|nr:hypothetical protein HanXRQr2_Chr17g0801491 [Helianthus annuus]KAJ0429037.1 hypothetical protein HanHA300_Chr17g0652811 [Helianthus annuus]KAJ0433340.1 hypothetical protein HanIR_Chr17g0869181 [Helianthus annuus]KAJ0447414.1 hypothetical protein HanHA89_Chr17g0705121 [Helianthus annuus]KAJ0632293.1 hypothetical protein HanLR1_Chr17g0663521 [Helianthus annuus]
MEEKFGREDSDSSDSDSDGDCDGGDTGVVGVSGAGASTAGAAGDTSASNDEEDTESDDNPPEPGYEVYFDERGVKRVRKIRREDDDEHVLSDTEAERLKKKQTVVRRKKKAKKNIGSPSVQQSVPKQEPTQEAEMNPNLGFTADEAADMVSSPPRSSEPTPMVTSAPETPSVTPQEPAPSIASTIRATTSQPALERRQTIFSQMPQDENIDFLFSQLEAAAGQINRQSTVINLTKGDMIKQQLEINTLNSTVGQQQAEITCQQAEIEQLKAENARLKAADEEKERQLQQMRAADNTRGIEMNRMKERSSELQRLAEALKEKHDYMKEWYNSRNTTIVDGVKRINDGFEAVRKGVNILWGDRCKQQEVLKKRDHDSEDLGNPDPSATSEQLPATTSTQIIVFQPSQLESTQGTSSGAVEEIQQLESSSYIESSLPGTSSVPSTADLALQAVHPITREILEEREFVSDLSHVQLLALNEMKTIEDSVIDQMPVEPKTADV